MAASQNDEPSQEFISGSVDAEFNSSSPLSKDFTFSCSGLDLFLDSLTSNPVITQSPCDVKNSGACAQLLSSDCLEFDTSANPRTPSIAQVRPEKYVSKEFEVPKWVNCFNRKIRIASKRHYLKTIKYTGNSADPTNTDTVTQLRFPCQLKSFYSENNFNFKTTLANTFEFSVDNSIPGQLIAAVQRKGKKNRLSLLERELKNDDCFSKRDVLPTEEDLCSAYDKLFPSHRIPFVYKCSEGLSCDNTFKCGQQVPSFTLHMEIKPTYGKPLPALVRENIDCLLEDSVVISNHSALIAVTAVKNDSVVPNKRLFVPVSFNLKDKIGCITDCFSNRTVPDWKVEVEEPVRCVVNDLLDFVDRQCEYVEVDYDPDNSPIRSDEGRLEDIEKFESSMDSFPTDVEFNSRAESLSAASRLKRRKRNLEKNKVIRELRKLMNVSVTDERSQISPVVKTEENCSKPACLLGCVCRSLLGKFEPSEHCGNVECMFACICSNKSRFSYVTRGELAKDEKTWHQTVIRKNNDDLEIQCGIDKTKRKKKVPSRYSNEDSGEEISGVRMSRSRLRKLTELDKNNSLSISNKQNISEPLCQLPDSGLQKNSQKSLPTKLTESAAIQNVPIKRSWKERVMDLKKEFYIKRFNSFKNVSAKSFAEIFIWCCVHNKYDCFCTTVVIMGKCNSLLHKPLRSNKCTVMKSLERTPFSSNVFRPVILYDEKKHCARSVGGFVDYKARNASYIFKKKTEFLIKNKIISFTNNFIKVKPLASASFNDSTNGSSVEIGNKSVGLGDIVKIKASLSSEDVDVEELDLDQFATDIMKQEMPDEDFDDSFHSQEDEAMEFIPKPSNQFTPSKFQPCFSVFKRKSIKTEPDSDEEIEEESCKSDFPFIASTTSLFEGVSVRGNPPPMARNLVNKHSQNTVSLQGKPLRKQKCNFGPNNNIIMKKPQREAFLSKPMHLIGDKELKKEPVSPPPIVEDDEYPKFGLFCMSHPSLGYLEVKESSPGNFTMVDPIDPLGIKVFKDCREANDFMKKLIGRCVNPEYASAEWVMVTRGVLEKYQSKRLHSGILVNCNVDEPAAKKVKIATDDEHENEASKKKPPSVKNLRKILPKVNDNSPKSLVGSLPVPAAILKNIGTFSNINKANSYIKTKFPSKMVVRQNIQISGAASNIAENALSKGQFVRIAPSASGSKLVNIPTNKGIKTVLVRRTAQLPHPLCGTMRPGITTSSTSSLSATNTSVYMNNLNLVKKVPSKISSVPLPKSHNPSMAVVDLSCDDSETARNPSITHPKPTFKSMSPEDSSFSQTSSTGTTLVIRPVRPILPKLISPSPSQSVLVKPKIPPRRADVIIPRKDGFATLISPAPSVSSSSPKIVSPYENNTFNGVLLQKSPKKNETKGYICDKKQYSKSGFRSLLQKR